MTNKQSTDDVSGACAVHWCVTKDTDPAKIAELLDKLAGITPFVDEDQQVFDEAASVITALQQKRDVYRENWHSTAEHLNGTRARVAELQAEIARLTKHASDMEKAANSMSTDVTHFGGKADRYEAALREIRDHTFCRECEAADKAEAALKGESGD